MKEKLVATITLHGAGRMDRKQLAQIGWWLIKQGWWLRKQKPCNLAAGRVRICLRWPKKDRVVPDEEGGL